MDRNGWNSLFSKRMKKLSAEELLVNNINLIQKPHILDLGCGDGRNTFFLAKNGFEVLAVDCRTNTYLFFC